MRRQSGRRAPPEPRVRAAERLLPGGAGGRRPGPAPVRRRGRAPGAADAGRGPGRARAGRGACRRRRLHRLHRALPPGAVGAVRGAGRPAGGPPVRLAAVPPGARPRRHRGAVRPAGRRPRLTRLQSAGAARCRPGEGGTVDRPPAIALLGLGEAGAEIARDLVAAGADVRGYDPRVTAPPGVLPRADEAAAVADADLVLSVNSAADAPVALRNALPGLRAGTVWADLNTAAPSVKRDLAAALAGRGVPVADVALLAKVPGE